MARRAYLDWNATAPLRPEARAAMIAAMDVVGNPSSVHAEGRVAKGLIEKARRQVAAAVGCAPQEVIFTSGATEGAQTLAGALGARHGLVCADVEHDALRTHQGEGLRLAVDGSGVLALAPETLAALPEDAVIAVQAANSETGVVQDVAGAVALIRAHLPGATVITDAVQAVGKIPFAFAWTGADGALISAHKFGGPKGVGAIIARGALSDRLEDAPLILGGGQEHRRRSGTENVIGIAGFGAAAEAAQRDLDGNLWSQIREFRDILEEKIAAADNMTIFVGKDANRLPNTSSFLTPGWKGETQVMVMDLAGFAVSAGSACSSGKVKASRTLKAMGYGETEAASAIRVSLGPLTTEEEVLRFAEAWARENEKFRARQ